VSWLWLLACSGADTAQPDSQTWWEDTGPEPEDTAPPEATFDNVQRLLLDEKCVGCHWGDPGSAYGDLALDVGAWSTLTQGFSTWGEPYVVAGDPAASVVFQKITDAQERGEGGVMPPYGSLEQAQVDLLEGWILAGAPSR